MQKIISENLRTYFSCPRVVGEISGKDFVFAHYDCDQDALVTAFVRGAFECQGKNAPKQAEIRFLRTSGRWSDLDL